MIRRLFDRLRALLRPSGRRAESHPPELAPDHEIDYALSRARNGMSP